MGKRINTNEFIGFKVGKVTVISFEKEIIGNKGRIHHLFRYRCICGNEGLSTKSNLKAARKINTFSCYSCRGIDVGQRNTTASLKYEDPLDAQCSIVYSNYKSKCKMKGWLFTISFNIFKETIIQNCHYCGDPPKQYRLDRAKVRQGISPVFINGIDRIDSTNGYTIDNILPCCQNCNLAKRSLSYKEFLHLITKIYEHKIKNN